MSTYLPAKLSLFTFGRQLKHFYFSHS